ncbi:glycosyltransferase [uncultured Lacinutrix sp.]|uniref:glycosyltransferase n=1 Tax=uncultured Lacinutrix sp. TaxID=574032 RepID=UPI002615FCA1|nr:glycosyltransferase [uncultured Lacinutrix sp.]
MNILFFISHQPNPRFIKQINYLAQNNTVTLLFFKRKTLADLNKSIAGNVVIHDLGEIPNASQPVKRISVYLKTIKKLKQLFKVTDFEVLLINNIDVLLLYNAATIFKKKNSKVAIEISDLREFVFSESASAKRMRSLEKRLYKKYIDKLIVTSKKYYEFHFSKFFTKEVFVLENKLLSKEIQENKIKEVVKNKKTTIGIVGLLLRKDEYIKLFETYKNSDSVDIHIHGKGQHQNTVEEYASKYNNITYFGPYNAFTDAEKIYKSLDIIYLVYDTDQVSLNNKLALPNKLYECMYYKVPLICSKDTYLAELVERDNIGVAINYKEENAIENAVSYVVSNNAIEDAFKSLPKDAYLGDNDYKKMEVFLAK